MKSMKRRHKRRVVLAVSAISVAVLAMGVWLLFFNNSDKRQVIYESTAAPSVSAETQIETPGESVLGESTVFPQRQIDPNDWRLLLVNGKHSLPEGFEVKLKELKNEQAVDERCYPDLQQMMDDCRAAGFQPLICSSYRSQEKQQKLFDNKVAELKKQGISDEEVREEAAKVIAVPGTSEHQTGLALDIVDINNQNLDESQENTPVQQWLVKNCWQYGFILRYPASKTDITGITYEPWHCRYVGKEAAQAIHDQGLCLEEYLSQPE